MKKFILISGIIISVILASCNTPTSTPIIEATLPQQLDTSEEPTQIISIPGPTITPGPVLNSTQESDSQPVGITQMAMFSETIGWGIGRGAENLPIVVQTQDGGRTWKDTKLPIDVSIYQGLQMAGYFLDDQNAWIAPFNETRFPMSENSVWRTSDSGATWNISLILQNELMESFYITQIFFVDALHGWFMSHVGAGMNHDYIVIYRTNDGGVNWEIAVDPMNDPSGIQGCQKNGFVFKDAQNGWLTGSCNGVAPGVLLFNTKDGGSTWSRVTLNDPDGHPGMYQSFDSVCSSQYPDASNGTIRLEVACKKMSAPLDRPIVNLYSSADDGKNWVQKSIPAGNLSYLPEDGLWVQGDQTSISWDGGMTWSELQDAPTGSSVHFLNKTIGWLITDNGELIFETTDGGKNWLAFTPILIE